MRGVTTLCGFESCIKYTLQYYVSVILLLYKKRLSAYMKLISWKVIKGTWGGITGYSLIKKTKKQKFETYIYICVFVITNT